MTPEMVPVEVTDDDKPVEAAAENEETLESETEEPSEEEQETVTDEGTFTSEPVPDEVFARMSGVSFPAGCTISREDLRYLRLSYHDFNGNPQLGELVCNKKIADDMTEIFRELYKRGYQIEKMKLIDDYGGDDDLSCADDNTSCFNYRTVAGSNNLSKHAMGVAIDINPFYNPYVTYPDGVERISPPGSEPYADRSADFPHKIGPGDDAYELFIAHGFTWGGNWKTLKDYQHFQKAD
ncbi:MAG: M15 family metallopeptidase [Lachnospiraceae bacterium]|nr:M15 family metallopeptidase [Lachnospiraceae bacterium]